MNWSLLLDLQNKKWVKFGKFCTIGSKYSATQIGKKMSAMERKFHDHKIDSSSPLFHLCESLCRGRAPKPEPKPEPEKRPLVITTTNVDHPTKEELEILLRFFTLQLTQYQILLQEIKRNSQSSTPKKKQRVEKNIIPQQLNDPSEDEKDGDQSQDEEFEIEAPYGGISSDKDMTLYEIEAAVDGGSSSNKDMTLDEIEEPVYGSDKDMTIVEHVELGTHEAMDLDLGGVGCSGKKTSSEKKKRRKKKKAKAKKDPSPPSEDQKSGRAFLRTLGVQPKKLVKKPIFMVRQEEDCGWDDDDDGLEKAVAVDSYDGEGDGDKKDVEEEDGPSSNYKKRKNIDVVINPEEYPELGMFMRLNHIEEELQQNWTVVGERNAAKLQRRCTKIMAMHMTVAAAKMELVHDILQLINEIET